MARHLLRDLENLKKELLGLGALVEEATNRAITALVGRRSELARDVVDGDSAIDLREVEVEEECLKMLALHQPVAADLRFIVAVIKVTNELERMGDLAVNIAERAIFLSAHPPIGVPLDFNRMVVRVQTMVRQSLDALVNLDSSLARRVCAEDDEVDGIHREMYRALEEIMHRNPDTIERAVQTLSSSRHLERIADHATNIAEDVVFLVEGDVVRHRLEETPPPKN